MAASKRGPWFTRRRALDSAAPRFTTTFDGAVPAPGSVLGRVLQDSGDWVPNGGGGGASGVADAYVAIAAQTLFTLSSIPAVPAAVLFFVNGQKQTYTTNYTVVGTTLTWLNVGFSMSAGDEVAAFYLI